MFEKTKAFLDNFLNIGIPGFDCLVYHEGKEVFRYMNGFSDIENAVPVKGNEIYNIYSCSKPITCTAALQLYEKGLFDPDDKLSDYIPEFGNMKVTDGKNITDAKNPITIRQLFTMTAGLTYDLYSPSLNDVRKETGGRCPTVETIKYLAKEPLAFDPGDQFRYSLCHDVLAALVEIISGKRYSVYVKENIFDVLGMENSTFDNRGLSYDGFAEQYIYDGNLGKTVKYGKEKCEYRLGTEYESGGAGCISTVEDYMKFLEAMRKGDIILKNDTIDMMNSPQISDYQHRTFSYDPVEIYTYGLGVRTSRDRSKLSEFGWDGAAASYLSVDREKNLCVFMGQHILDAPNFREKDQVRQCIVDDMGI